MKNILILGGAGFIGSNLVKRLSDIGHNVTIIDGLIPNTGASIDNIEGYQSRINLIPKKVEEVSDLPSILNQNELIIDCMGWTSHHLAILDPTNDINMNVLSHLKVIEALKGLEGKKIIYLGSRGQYGNHAKPTLEESDCMNPEDVQGINKLSAENYYRVYSKFYKYDVISLRIPNCFGIGQSYGNSDIGLVGSFIKEALCGNTIEVYGNHRKRSILYVEDLVNIIINLKEIKIEGFAAYNINGTTVLISELAEAIVKASNSGSVKIKPLPDEIIKMEMGSASLSETKLRQKLPDIKYTEINTALKSTINYFKQKL